MTTLASADQAKVDAVHDRLVAAYGRLTLAPGGDPLDELIGTILSQNTSDVNSGRAYAQLRAMYPTWEEVLDTSDDELYEAIKSNPLKPRCWVIGVAVREVDAPDGKNLICLNILTMDLTEILIPMAAREVFGPAI